MPRVGSSILITLCGNAFPPIAAVVTAPVLARALGVTERGEVAAALAPYLLLTLVAALGVPEAVTYSVARDRGFLRRTTLAGLGIVTAAGLLSFAGVARLRGWLSGYVPATQHLIIIAALAIVPGLCLGVVRGAASGLNMWGLVASERLITSFARLVGILGLAAEHRLSPLAATLVLAVSPMAGGLVYLYLLVAPAKRRPPPSVRPEGLGRYAARVWVGALAGILLMRLDQILMVPLSTSNELGLYVVAVAVAEVPLVINSAVRDVSFALEAAHQSLDRLASSARICSSVSLVACLVTSAVVPYGLPRLFGSDFAGAVPATLVLLLGVVAVTQGSVPAAGLSGRGHPGLRSMSLVWASVVNVILILALVPKFGATGAAWATVVGNAVFSAGGLFWMRRLYGVPYRRFFGIRRDDFSAIRRQLHRKGATGAALVR